MVKKIINKKNFTKAKNNLVNFKSPNWFFQIKKIIILTKYLDFVNVFLKIPVWNLSNYIKINKYLIDLLSDKKPYNRPNYNLK